MPRQFIVDSLFTALAGGLLALDRTYALQILISRPVVAGPVTGFILGDTAAGLYAGIIAELLTSGDLPLGSYVPIHETALAVLAATVASGLSGPGMSGLDRAALVAPAITIGLPLSGLFRRADLRIRMRHGLIFDALCERLASGEEVNLQRENLKGLVPAFLYNLGLFAATVPPLLAGARWLSGSIDAGLYFKPALAGSAAVAFVAAFRASSGTLYIFLASGAAAALFWMLFLRGAF